ncbi:MAG: hypothetical protein ACOC2E_04575 [Bacteroidota bacterium]
MGRLGIPMGFRSLGLIHQSNPVIIITDLLPLIFGISAYYLFDVFKNQNKRFEDLSTQLANQTRNINTVARFAEEIGNGKYDIDFEVEDESDTLGKTIQNLRDKLYDNNQKESLQNWEMRGKDKIG